MSTPPAPTDAEMIAWCERRADVAEGTARRDPNGQFVKQIEKRAAMLRAIAERVREPSAGKSEPQTPWTGEDGQ